MHAAELGTSALYLSDLLPAGRSLDCDRDDLFFIAGSSFSGLNAGMVSRGRFGSRLAEFFGLKRNLVILLIATFTIGAGEELWLRFLPKYLQALGAGIFVIGLFDAIRTLLGALYAYPGGVLVDRWGHRRAFLAFNLFSIAGYALVLAFPHWGAVIAGMFLFLSWTSFSLPASFSLIGATLGANRHAMGVGVQMVIKRVPIMIAPIIGGYLIDAFGIINGTRIGLAVSIALSAMTLLVQRQLRDQPMDPNASTEHWNFWQSLRSLGAPLRRLLVSDILVRFCERIPFAWVVIYAMDHIGVSAKEIGVLTTIEVVVASACILPVSYFADKHGREPFVLITFGFFTLFPLALWFSDSFALLAVAFVIRGLKEFGDTSRKALIIGLCDPARRGQMIGAYYLVRDLLVSAGAFIGAWLWKIGSGANFLGATFFGLCGTAIYLLSSRAKPQREREPVQTGV
ncbi:MAG TPA: MFS transporter [Chthoniobacterales bacterium]|nr:MFS transporter [Chthoniobacterales bacterium]